MSWLIPVRIQDSGNRAKVYSENYVSDKYLNIISFLKELESLFEDINITNPNIAKIYQTKKVDKWIDYVTCSKGGKYLIGNELVDEEEKKKDFIPITTDAKSNGITFDLTRQVVYFNIWDPADEYKKEIKNVNVLINGKVEKFLPKLPNNYNWEEAKEHTNDRGRVFYTTKNIEGNIEVISLYEKKERRWNWYQYTGDITKEEKHTLLGYYCPQTKKWLKVDSDGEYDPTNETIIKKVKFDKPALIIPFEEFNDFLSYLKEIYKETNEDKETIVEINKKLYYYW